MKVSALTIEDGAPAVRFPHARVANDLYKVKDVFNAIDTSGSGRLSYQDVCLAFKTLTNEDLTTDVARSLADKTFLFEDFCCLLSEYRYREKSMLQKLATNIYRLPSKLYGWLSGRAERRSATSVSEPRRRDVFLGGSCGSSRWRDEIAVPMLLKHGVSFYNPQLEGWSTHYIPLEAAVKDCCRLLLYVISEDTRAMTSMIEAGYFIGQGCHVILCLQDMKHGICIDNHQLSQNAIGDYNRARLYLADLANRDGVPVLNDISEAVNCAIQRLREFTSD